MEWFRCYADFATNPKVQIMPEHMQRRLIMLLCLRCSDVLVTLHETEIACAMRITDVELDETKRLFIAKNFIDNEWNLLEWDKMQYLSDSSSERTRRYRERKKEEQERHKNVTVTPPDTDTDTDKERKKDKKITQKKVSLQDLSTDHIRDWLAKKRSEGVYLQHDELKILETFKNYCLSKGKKYADFTAAYRNAFEWDQFQPGRKQSFVDRGDKHQRTLEAAVRGHIRAENPDF